MNEYLLFGLIF